MTLPAVGNRRLAAVMATDVAGYSRMISADEEGTVAHLNEVRNEVWLPKIGEFAGRLVDTAGDGMLIEFGSAVNAARFSLDLQRSMAERNRGLPDDRKMMLRIGIHLSEILFDETRIYGDGVNIAARLEQLAEPGGILASDSVCRELDGRLPVDARPKGDLVLKNIPYPVRAFALEPADTARRRPYFSVDRPAMAILPFDNLTDDPGQSYFVDGFVDDLITEMSRIRWLMVIARTSTFAYRDQSVDVRRLSTELGARYILGGSIRRRGDALRITCRLDDGATGTQIWADRFDSQIDDVFDLQDDIVRSVVAVIEPTLRSAEIGRAKRKPTNSVDAYDLYLKALAHRYALTATDNRQAAALLAQVIEIDPRFSTALAHAANCICSERDQGWGEVSDERIAEALTLAERAVEADGDDPLALCLAGHVVASLAGDNDRALAMLERSLQINANSAEAWARASMIRIYAGQLDGAAVYAERSLRLNPRDPESWMPRCTIALAHLFSGRYEAALKAAHAVVVSPHQPATAYRICLVALVRLGRIEEARRYGATLLKLSPNFTIAGWRRRTPFRLPDQVALQLDAFEVANLPK